MKVVFYNLVLLLNEIKYNFDAFVSLFYKSVEHYLDGNRQIDNSSMSSLTPTTFTDFNN